MSPEPARAGSFDGWSILNLGGALPPGFITSAFTDGIGDGFPSCAVSPVGQFLVSFDSLAQFLIAPDDRSVTIFDVASIATSADLDHLLYDHVAPRLVAEQGALVLHGSAVEIDGALAVFLGETGAGKSTLAASLHNAGYRLHGDDAVVIEMRDGRYVGRAVYPSLRLYPETIAAVLGNQIPTTQMAHYSDKLRVTLSEATSNDIAAPAPIAALFLLSGEDSDLSPEALEMRPSEACMALVGQSFTLDPGNAGKAADRLQKISALGDTVPIYRLTYPRDFGRFKELHDVIRSCITRAQAPAALSTKAKAG